MTTTIAYLCKCKLIILKEMKRYYKTQWIQIEYFTADSAVFKESTLSKEESVDSSGFAVDCY